jgi:hypothetical protein
MDHTATRSRAGAKPVDVGNGSLAASFGASNAALLSLLAPHPGYGSVELCAVPPFDERHRGDPVEARRFRARLTDDRLACLHLESADGDAFRADELVLEDPLRPVWHGTVGAVRVQASAAGDPSGVAVTWRVESAGAPPPIRLRFEGRLDRPALAEVTETDPPSPTGASTILGADGCRLQVASPELAATIVVDVGAGTWIVEGSSARLEVPPSTDDVLASVRCSTHLARPAPAPVAMEPSSPVDGLVRPIVARALAYVRGCTALATSADERAILTDHRILPLSWTRDAYYQALLLLAADGPGDRDRVADHLRWLWRRCERPDGRWVRSHHADGRRKDRALQADQQLYPILELADFWRRTGALPSGVDWTVAVDAAWSAALREIDPATGLVASAETPSDDPAAVPFIASSQILFWYTARRLEEMASAGTLATHAAGLDGVARRVRAAFDTELVDGERWAYATDGAGARVAYHDANDMPTALAPLWGFCAADDPGWRSTMAWAYSPANPGYAPGERGGLGSAHTPGTWTLGDVQAWIRGRVTGDAKAMEAALKRLRAVAFDDGMLPEAYSVTTEPDVRVRHWFAWPGAAVGALLILDARGELERVLRA